MRIDAGKVAVSAGVGIADEALAYLDEKWAKTEPFRTATDVGRLVITGLGFAMQAFDMRPRLGETVALAAMPLLVKSIAKPVRAAIGEQVSPVRRYVPTRRASTPLPSGPASKSTGTGTRYAEEFHNVKLA